MAWLTSGRGVRAYGYEPGALGLSALYYTTVYTVACGARMVWDGLRFRRPHTTKQGPPPVPNHVTTTCAAAAHRMTVVMCTAFSRLTQLFLTHSSSLEAPCFGGSGIAILARPDC